MSAPSTPNGLDIPARLRQLEQQLTVPTETQAAQRQLSELISGLPEGALLEHEAALRETAQQFLPKRRRSLTALLESRLGTSEPKAEANPGRAPDVAHLRATCDQLLRELSERYIFQWSTHYVAAVSAIYRELLELSAPPEALAVARGALRAHAAEIFSKGYEHNTARLCTSVESARAKALNGLTRFLDIPIQILVETARSRRAEMAASRLATASLVSGILLGFSEADLGGRGSALLLRYPRRWAHALAFLSQSELAAVTTVLEAGEFRTGVEVSVSPVAAAVERFFAEQESGYVGAGEFEWSARRLLILLHLTTASGDHVQLELHVFLDGAYVSREALGHALRAAPTLIAAPVRPDVLSALPSSATNIVDVTPRGAPAEEQVSRCLAVLRQAIARESVPREEEAPPRANYAEGFPLETPNPGEAYLVHRESVRALLDQVRTHHAAGISLWTSIRRSGKTTAARELGRYLSAANVLYQTMFQTEQYKEKNILADGVQRALEEAHFLPQGFFRDLVARAADVESADAKTVLIIDEYERLFQIINQEALASERVRLRVCSPLLSQITEFAQDNLVVLLGMDPSAHYILMAENQLSAYVRPTRFPLFQHSSGDDDSEFTDLVEKVISKHVEYAPTFCDVLHAETGGHPYLTVNLLRDFLDWLIAERRSIPRSGLDGATLADYLQALDAQRIRQSGQFNFFRQFAREALSGRAETHVKWLAASMRVLQRVAASDNHAISYGDAVTTVGTVAQGLDPVEVIESAVRANFLVSADGESVRPAIPLLARIIAAEGRLL